MRLAASVIVITLLSALAALPSRAQTGDTATDSRNWLNKTIDFFFFDIDTSFITPNRYRMNVSLKSDINFDNYVLREGKGETRALTISQTPAYSLGAYIGWEVLTVGWSFDINETFMGDMSRERNTAFSFSLMGTFIGCDLYYRNNKDGFRITKSVGFGNTDYRQRENRSVEGIETKIAGFNAWYIFNRRRLAYPAVYAHSSKQRRSCGSLMVGASYTMHDFSITPSRFPDDYEDFITSHPELTDVAYHNISIGVGYTYNFAFLSNFTANITLLPSVAYHISRLRQSDDHTPVYNNFNFDMLAKAGVTYNNGRFFAGCTAQFRTYFNRRTKAAIINNAGTVSIFTGFNFWRKHPR